MAFPIGHPGLQVALLAALSGASGSSSGFRRVDYLLYGIPVTAISGREFVIFQPAFFGELALMLWLVIKGAKPPALYAAASSSTVGAGV
jgi:hypothetical protein